MDTEDKINHLTALIEASLLPELRYELGSNYIEAQHFDKFRQDLDINLIQIFDLIQQNEDLLYEIEGNTRKLRCNFILLLCEQSAPDTPFQTQNSIYLKNVQTLIEKHISKMLATDEQLSKPIFDYYKERLRKNCWKKKLGCIHGFCIFCQIYCRSHQFSQDLCTFVLSVSLLLEDFYEPSYKEMGFRLIDLILSETPKSVLKELNIHEGVHDTLFRNIPKASTVSGVISLWECLYKCMEVQSTIDYSKWNKMDDIFEALMRRIALESDINIFIHLLTLFPKFCLINIKFDSNEIDLSDINNPELNDENLKGLRDISKTIRPKVFYRWVTRLLNLLIAESHKLMLNEDTAIRLLKVFHVCYIVCVATIPLKVCEPHLVVFLDKFTSVLMEVIASHKKSQKITRIVRQFLETILSHLDCQQCLPPMSDKMLLYKDDMVKLLEKKHMAVAHDCKEIVINFTSKES